MKTSGPSLWLELLNGSGFIVDAFFCAWGLWYLVREARRRRDASGHFRLPLWRWVLDLPAPMNFILAVIIHDGGVASRSIAIWIWRRFFDAGDLGPWLIGLLVAGSVGIVAGGLLKIRAVTRPVYGDGPWLACAYLLAIFLAGSLFSR